MTYQDSGLEGSEASDVGLYWACKCVWLIYRRHLAQAGDSLSCSYLPPSLRFPLRSLSSRSFFSPQVSLDLTVIVSADFRLHCFAESRRCHRCHFHLPVCLSGCRPMTLRHLKGTREMRRRKKRALVWKEQDSFCTHTHKQVLCFVSSWRIRNDSDITVYYHGYLLVYLRWMARGNKHFRWECGEGAGYIFKHCCSLTKHQHVQICEKNK